jgi:hypothetical protein
MLCSIFLSPAMIWNRLPTGLTIIGWSKPVAFIDSESSTRPALSKLILACSLLENISIKGVSQGRLESNLPFSIIIWKFFGLEIKL